MASTADDENADGTSSGFIRFEVNVSDIISAGIFSPVIEVRGTPWKLCVKKKGCFLAVYLYHRKSDSNIWSIDVSCEFMLINTVAVENIIEKFRHSFNHEIGNLGFGDFAEWETVIDNEKGFIKDGKIIVEARFTLSKIVGIRVTPRFDFTDPNKSYHDVTLLIDEKKIYASKQILAVHSPVLEAMFYGGFVEKGKQEIELKDINCKEFIEMLNLIYPTHAKISDATVESLLKLADRFQITSILDKAEQFLIDSAKLDIPSKLKLSDEFRLVKLQEHCLDTFTIAKDVLDLKKTDCYKSLSDKAKLMLLDKAMNLNAAT